jgi:hypothetical protein
VDELLEDQQEIFVVDWFHHILKSGGDVFVDDVEDESTSEDHTNEKCENIFPTDRWTSGIVELITECGDDTKEEQIGEGEVPGVGDDGLLETRHLRVDERELSRVGVVLSR